MTNEWHKILVVISTTLLLTTFPGVGMSNVTCGQIITKDTTLNADVICQGNTPYAIEFGASNITLDLGGYSIVGQSPVEGDITSGITVTGITATDKQGITIRNGVIEGFVETVFLSMSDNVTLSDLTLRNPRGVGINARLCENLLIKDSFFDLPLADIPEVEVEGIIIYGTTLKAQNIDVRNGTVGVNLSFSQTCDAENLSSGEVLNSRFTGSYLSSIRVACSNNARIAGNTFTYSNAISCDGSFPGAVKGIIVEDNEISDTGRHAIGVEFRGVIDSKIMRNTVSGLDAWGISLKQSLGCINPNQPGWECFYSTNNIISDNVVLDNRIDLYHDAGSSPNTWESNTCRTKSGADIPSCFGPGLPWLPLLLD